MEYPLHAIPDLFAEHPDGGTAVRDPSFDFGTSFLDVDYGVSMLPLAMNGSVGPSLLAPALTSIEVQSHPSHPSAESASTSEPQTMSEMSQAIQKLRKEMRLVEERQAHPTQREKYLEMVIGILWQALQSSDSPTTSAKTKPDSPCWQLVATFARNVLSTTATNFSSHGTSIPSASPNMATVNPASLNAAWEFGGGNSSGRAFPLSDSGYTSGNMPS